MNQALPIERPRLSLLQFWDKDTPEDVAALLDSVEALNPELEYTFFDDAAAKDFIRDAYGADMLALYDSSALPAMRADLFRYCWLALHGGFYVDADYGSRQPLAPLLTAERRGIFYERPKGICNSAIYFRDAGDPLAARILEDAVRNVRERRSHSVWDMSGPAVIQRLYRDESTRPMFDGFYLIHEEEFKRYFDLADSLPYKSTERHWFVAKHKGISPFRDDEDRVRGDGES